MAEQDHIVLQRDVGASAATSSAATAAATKPAAAAAAATVKMQRRRRHGGHRPTFARETPALAKLSRPRAD